jgi:uncharacterized protein (TIGR01777 family)
MHRVIAGGTGLIGRRLVDQWLKQNHTITIIGRSQQHIQNVFGSKVLAVTWDKLTSEALKSTEVIVNLTGENVGGASWSQKRKHEIVNSRVGSTKKIVSILSEITENPPRLFNASAIGVYGLQTAESAVLPPAFDEDANIDWDHPKDFMSLVGRRWEKAADPAIQQGINVVFLRFGVVLSMAGGALPELIKPYKYYLGGTIGTGFQPISWVVIDDVVRAIDFLLSKPDASGPFNIVAPGAVSQAVFARILGSNLNSTSFMRTPAFLLKMIFGEMAEELILKGQNVYPKRLLEMGFKFAYPELESALNHVLVREASSGGKMKPAASWLSQLMDKFKKKR